MTITAKMVKELRDITGVGMMDAKKALTESNGDFESASDWLRQKGLAKAQKKSGRIAAEGLIGIKLSSDSATLIESNCETDFVARNKEFQDMIIHILDNAAGKTTLSEILSSTINDRTVDEFLIEKVSNLENDKLPHGDSSVDNKVKVSETKNKEKVIKPSKVLKSANVKSKDEFEEKEKDKKNSKESTE